MLVSPGILGSIQSAAKTCPCVVRSDASILISFYLSQGTSSAASRLLTAMDLHRSQSRVSLDEPVMTMYHDKVPPAQSPSVSVRGLGRCVRSKLRPVAGQAIRYSRACTGRLDWMGTAAGLGSRCMFGAQLAARDAAMPVPQKKKHNRRTSQSRNRSETGEGTLRLVHDGS